MSEESLRDTIRPYDKAEVLANMTAFAPATGHASEEWLDPEPLDAPRYSRTKEDILTFLSALPDGMREAVRELQAYCQAPPEMIAQVALASLSLAAQGLANVRLDSQRTAPLSLALLTVAESGERKTTVDKAFSKPFDDWEREEAFQFHARISGNRAAISAHEEECVGLRAAIREASKKNNRLEVERATRQLVELEAKRPKEIVLPNLKYSDVNAQALANSLMKGRRSVALWSNEAGTVFGSGGMNRENATGFTSMLNSLWDGGRISQIRKSAQSVIVDGARVTSMLMIQPGVLEEVLSGNLRNAVDIGFWPRFLVCEPESTIGHRRYRAAPENTPAMEQFNERIRELLDMSLSLDESGSLSPPALLFDEAVGPDMEFLSNLFEVSQRRGGSLEQVRGFASKGVEQACRLAALFHIFRHGPEFEKHPICQADFEMGGRCAKHFLHCALDLFGRRGPEPESIRDARKIEKYLQREGGAASPQTILQHCHISAAQRDAGASELVERHRMRIEGGRGDTRYVLNPGLM
jgi:hypothetical protein